MAGPRFNYNCRMLASESAPEPSGSQAVATSRRPRRSWLRLAIVGLALAIWFGTAFWETHKPLPPGTHTASDWYSIDPSAVRFIADVTAADAYGRPVVSHAAFDAMLQTVRAARELVLVDAFRFANDPPLAGTPLERSRPIATELLEALIARKLEQPGLRVLVIVDPVNVEYGRRPSADLERLQEAGIDVVVANLDALRDSNFLYSSLWRLAARWWASRTPEESRLSAALTAANLKADRRNLLIADDGTGGLTGILSATELSPAGASDSNIAMQLAGPVLVRLLRSEIAIARFSGWTGVLGAPTESDASDSAPQAAGAGPPARRTGSRPTGSRPTGARPTDVAGESRVDVRVFTEGAFRDALIHRVLDARSGDAIDIAAFYLSDRAVIESLVAASRRGAAVRIILDPGEDAFGRTGAGIPNRSVAGELLAASDGAIRVRWYRTHGERFHAGLVLMRGRQRTWLAVGSASLTRRSLEDYDLHASAVVALPSDSALAQQASVYFETLWSNRAALGIEYTADVGVYADASQLDYWRYRLMEATGLSLF